MYAVCTEYKYIVVYTATRLKFFVAGIFIYIAVVMNKVEVALLSGIDVIL